MKFSKSIEMAEKHRRAMMQALKPINEALLAFDASVEYQSSDGWVVLFNDDHNAPWHRIDFDALMNMNREAALKYLMQRSI